MAKITGIRGGDYGARWLVGGRRGLGKRPPAPLSCLLRGPSGSEDRYIWEGAGFCMALIEGGNRRMWGTGGSHVFELAGFMTRSPQTHLAFSYRYSIHTALLFRAQTQTFKRAGAGPSQA